MSKAWNLTWALLIWAALWLFDWGDEAVVQELYDDWYEPEEIADELWMDEDEVREIVWEEDEDRDYWDYDY